MVALIVTIIILLILAGVTIAILSGEDGILSRTEKVATTYQTEKIKEVVNLKLANLNASKWIDEGRKAVLKDLNELDDENSPNFDAEIALKNQVQDSDTTAILIYDHHEIEVDSLLNIVKVDGEKRGETNNDDDDSTNGDNSSEIDSAEYAEMKETIADLKSEVSDLKNTVANLTNDMGNNVNTGSTSFTTIFKSEEGASSGVLEESILNYDYIIVIHSTAYTSVVVESAIFNPSEQSSIMYNFAWKSNYISGQINFSENTFTRTAGTDNASYYAATLVYEVIGVKK